MAYDLLHTHQKIFHDFQEWAFSNKVLVGASAFAIGVATKEVIERLLVELVRPVIMMIVELGVFKTMYNYALVYVPEQRLDGFMSTIGNVSWSILEWIAIILMTFIILEYFLNRQIIGLKSSVQEQQKTDFVKAKAEANENIIPTHQEVQKLHQQEKLEKQAGQKIVKQDEKNLEKAAASTSATPGHQLATANGRSFEDYVNKSKSSGVIGLGDDVFLHIFQ